MGVEAADPCLSFVWLNECGEDPDESSLSTTVSSENTDDLAPTYLQCHVVENRALLAPPLHCEGLGFATERFGYIPQYDWRKRSESAHPC